MQFHESREWVTPTPEPKSAPADVWLVARLAARDTPNWEQQTTLLKDGR